METKQVKFQEFVIWAFLEQDWFDRLEEAGCPDADVTFGMNGKAEMRFCRPGWTLAEALVPAIQQVQKIGYFVAAEGRGETFGSGCWWKPNELRQFSAG